MPCDIVFNCFKDSEFNFKGLFMCNQKKKKSKQEISSILDNIEKMGDYMVNKRVVINVVCQQIKKILECEYYILHRLDLQGHKMNVNFNASRIYNIEDYTRFLRYKNACIEHVDIESEVAMMEQYIQNHLLEDGSVNYVSKNFMDNCSSRFIDKYFTKDCPMQCTTNLNIPDNIFGHCIKTNKYFITNDIYSEEVSACRFADGHPVIKKFMCIPFANANGVVYGICGFANSNRTLCDKDYKLIKPVINALNSILPDLLDE